MWHLTDQLSLLVNMVETNYFKHLKNVFLTSE